LAAARARRKLRFLEEVKRFSVDVMTLLVFGHDSNTIERPGDPITRHLDVIFPGIHRRLFSVFPTWRYVRLPADRRLQRAVDEVQRWLIGMIHESRRHLEADPERAARPRNFIEAMLTARDDSGRPFSDEVILGNVTEIVLAGEDTTSSALAWAVHHLCDRPDEVSALRRELDDVLGDSTVVPDFETANRLAYTTAIANEVMRLRPPVPVIFLETNTETVLGDVRLPKGTEVYLPVRPVAASSKYFDTPAAFRPSRWISPKGVHDPSVFIPFGSGPRMCPGRSLSILEMRVVLAMLYRAFDVERVGRPSDVEERFTIAMEPMNLDVRLHPRPRA
jgi:cytochrome P450